MLAGDPICVHCRRRPATEADHSPPLARHVHVDGGDCCVLLPSCSLCARRQGAILARRVTPPRPPAASPLAGAAPPTLEPDGWPADDDVWDVPWLEALRDVPADATWPRLMTPPHPAAVGTYGAEVDAAALERTGKPMRWWQRLLNARALEHDADGLLLWDAVDLTVARQVGKSYAVREAALWRIRQGRRWGEAQAIVHTGKDVAICVEIQRPARRWAKAYPDLYKVREQNGAESIEYLVDGSRWLVKAKDSVYGLSASMAVVDEAWAVPAIVIEEGLVPTQVELVAAQLWNLSTGHRKATALMVNRRNAALADLASTAGDLWLEWSARPDAADGDVAAWRAASPHWTERRRRMIAARLAAATAPGAASDDPDEPDPLEAFRAQWLNRWPAKRRKAGHGEPLLGDGVWDGLAGALAQVDGPGVVALEENRGEGAAAAFVAGDGAGRFEVDGRACASWSEAIAIVRRYVDARPGARLIVGARMNNQLPADLPGRLGAQRAGTTETGRGLVLLRALAAERRVVHDDTADLDAQLARARVHNLTGGGLGLVNNNARTDLLRACLWALDAAQVTPPTPAVR